MTGFADRIYAKMPVLAQHAMVSAYGFYWNRQRFGGQYRMQARAYQSRELYSTDEWHAYTEQRLREALVLAFTRVPHYREAWKHLVTTAQLRKFTVKDLASLPPLEKATARDNPLELLIDGRTQKRHQIQHTSGSTGTPVRTFWLPEELSDSLAIRHTRYSAFAGVGYDRPRATFSGRLVEPNPQSKGPYYRFNIVERQVYFSAFHLGPETAQQYVDALRRHRIEWITGYSNSIYQLAQHILDQQIEAPQIKAVITTSEKLTSEMRLAIAKAFGAHVHEEYAAVEGLFFACDNEYGQLLVSPDCGLIELVDERMQPVPVGEYGEVLVTGFTRLSQPMIRYRIGDTAAFSDEEPLCGRGMPVLKEVLGRTEDTIYGPDGRRMVRFHGIFVNQPHVREGQVIQERLDHIRVKVVTKPGYSEADTKDIISRVQQRLTSQVHVEVELVDHIERTKAGKFRAVISNLSPEERTNVPRS
jgi:phenylacetate-CoA ligase